MSFRLSLLVFLLASTGCLSSRRERLREPGVFPVTARAVPFAERVVVLPFVDARGPELGRAYASNVIPGVNFLHSGGRSEYPETYGGFGDPKQRQTLVVGELATETPYLIARGLGRRVAVEDDVPKGRDYVVTGAIIRSTATWHASFVLAMVSVFGVPAQFYRAEMRVRVVVHHASRPDEPLLSKTYDFDARRRAGLYYGYGADRKLARAALRHVVDAATKDIATAIARDRSLRR